MLATICYQFTLGTNCDQKFKLKNFHDFNGEIFEEHETCILINVIDFIFAGNESSLTIFTTITIF